MTSLAQHLVGFRGLVTDLYPGIADALQHWKQPVWSVGGAPRDVALGRPLRDLDLVVEGDGHALAHWLARTLPEVTRAHTDQRFLTARLLLADGGKIDVVTARSEHYPAPGVLPVVRPGSLADDLARRDFTINTIGVRVNGPSEVRAHPRAWADLRAGRLRVLHDQSFVDDPTRILRLARYMASLGFRPASATARLAAQGLGGLASVSPGRIAADLDRMIEDDICLAGVTSLLHLGVPPGGPWSVGSLRRLGPAAPPLQVWACLLLDGLDPETVPRPARRMAERVQQVLRTGPGQREDRLARLGPDELAIAAAVLPPVGAALARRLHEGPPGTLPAHDVQAALPPEAPDDTIGHAIRALRVHHARSGPLSHQEQLDWVHQWSTLRLLQISRMS